MWPVKIPSSSLATNQGHKVNICCKLKMILKQVKGIIRIRKHFSTTKNTLYCVVKIVTERHIVIM